jgi:hypothetical protein
MNLNDEQKEIALGYAGKIKDVANLIEGVTGAALVVEEKAVGFLNKWVDNIEKAIAEKADTASAARPVQGEDAPLNPILRNMLINLTLDLDPTADKQALEVASDAELRQAYSKAVSKAQGNL